MTKYNVSYCYVSTWPVLCLSKRASRDYLAKLLNDSSLNALANILLVFREFLSIEVVEYSNQFVLMDPFVTYNSSVDTMCFYTK